MALVNFLKIDAVSGLQSESDPSSDELNLQDVQLQGTSLVGTSGVDIIGDTASAYTNISPGGDTLQDTLNAIDSALGTVVSNECLVSQSFSNGEASPITLGQAVYISGNDQVMLADNDVNAKDDPIGLVADASIAAAATGSIFTHGCAAGVLAGATAGTKYFLDSTPGALTTTVPSGSGKNVVWMGTASSATDLYLRIQNIGKRV